MNKWNSMIFCVLFLMILICSSCGQEKENLSFQDRIQAVPKDSGFKMEDYWVWGGSMIKAKGEYHLFCSRWPKGEEFPKGYLTGSEIVRATAKTPLGPFTFQEVVIGERDSSYWDSNMAHNPTIYQVEDTFVLYYIGSNFNHRNAGWPPYHRSIGYATATNINGPWQRSEKPVIKQESNNPAAYFEEDGSVKLVFRDAPLKVSIATADNYQGPYSIQNDDVWPECKLEDFYLFKHNQKYHLICEDNVGGVSGHTRWGVQLVSENGINGWRKYEPVLVYDHDIVYEDGSILHCTRRERPQLLIEGGKVTHLITGVYDGENSWCQPVELKPYY